MTEYEQLLLALLKERSFRRGTFQLASGGTSNYYIDCRMATLCAAGLDLIGRVIYDCLRDLDYDAIGGMQVGAVPLAAATILAYNYDDAIPDERRPPEGFWVRDTAKDHGTGRTIEGHLCPGNQVVIVENVATTGRSALKAIEAVRGYGCKVVALVALVDRLQGAAGLFREHGIGDYRYRPIFTVRDFGVED